MSANLELFPVGTYGSIRVRYVILKKLTETAAPTHDDEPELSEGDDDPGNVGRTPLDSYLERSRFGKHCIVFLVNGQRHHALDQVFISRDLGFKYLKNRMMIIVELDGLAPEAIAEIVQGSRQGLYQGDVYFQIEAKILSALKKDKELQRLQSEAEEELARLQAGDEAVKEALDQLIDSHHTAGPHDDHGEIEPGTEPSQTAISFGRPAEQVVVVEGDTGEQATEPVLVLAGGGAASIRVTKEQDATATIGCRPATAWSDLELFTYELTPTPDSDELSVVCSDVDGGRELTFCFTEPEDFDDDEYPLEYTLSAFAKFRGHAEPRMLTKRVVVTKVRKKPEAKPKPVLLPTPTALKVLSRQPVKLIAGEASTHVRLRWNGEDSLATGPNPAWTFSARCVSLANFPPMSFSDPRDGRFELLVDAPHGVLPNQDLEFEVVAHGPAGATLTAKFKAVVFQEPPAPEPRKVTTLAPDIAAQRRPPYQLKYVKEEEWNAGGCWNDSPWTAKEAAAYQEPTGSSVLTLIINEDFEGLKAFRDAMKDRKLEEATVKKRINRYASHIGFHLYQMYRAVERLGEQSGGEGSRPAPTEAELRDEINRVATTMLKVMDVLA